MSQLTSDQIRLLRLSRGMGQKDAAAQMNITTQRYSQLENHTKDLPADTLQRILKALGYTRTTAMQYLKSIPPPANVARNKS